MKDTGIIIVAIGANTFTELAQNLCITLKKSAPNIPVSIIADKQPDELTEYLFDEWIEAPKGVNPFELKTLLYSLSPYKKTIYIDADTIFNHLRFNLTDWIEGLGDCDLAFNEREVYKKGSPLMSKLAWVNLSNVWADHLKDGGEYPAIQSSVIYFRKSKPARSFFNRAKKLYGQIKCDKIRGHFPDEVAFSMAAAQLGIRSGANVALYTAEGNRCDEGAILMHPWITYPGMTHTREHLRLYGAMVNKASNAVLGVGGRVFRK